jgi:hypothetical protein
MPLLCHKNVVRYYSSWIEGVEPSQKTIGIVVKQAEA